MHPVPADPVRCLFSHSGAVVCPSDGNRQRWSGSLGRVWWDGRAATPDGTSDTLSAEATVPSGLSSRKLFKCTEPSAPRRTAGRQRFVLGGVPVGPVTQRQAPLWATARHSSGTVLVGCVRRQNGGRSLRGPVGPPPRVCKGRDVDSQRVCGRTSEFVCECGSLHSSSSQPVERLWV